MAHKYDEMYHLEKSIPDYWALKKLKDLAFLVTDRIDVSKVSLENYVSTENMLPNKSGIEKAIKMPRYGSVTRFESRDILLSNIRPYFKKIWLAKFNGGCSNDVLVIKAKNDVSHSFLYYCLQQDPFFNYVTSSSKGTKMPRGDKVAIFSFEFPVPPLDEQKAIAKILSDLDSKIELNEKMNKTLETIAQAIFKHWFIDFEFPNEEGKPYKSSGGEMVDSELGSIPKGWKVKYFKDIVHLNMGVSPKGTSYNTDGIGVPLLNGAADFSSGIIEPKKFTTNPVRMCKKGDLLFCIRATIGNLTYSDKAYCIGRGVAALDPVSEVYKEYSYFTLEYGLNNLILKASGSVIKGLSKDDLLLFKIVTPTDKIISKFHLLVATIFSRIQYLTVENHSLSNIRDSLLPKLMTGKIRVPMEDEHE